MVLIILLSTVPIFSTDMYLPAIPKMVEGFGAPLKMVNLTLVLFLIFFAGSSLIWGTLSDKYGRKPVLLISTGIYSLASFLCAASDSVYHLIGFRMLQGIGGGAAMTMAMAMVKDAFIGKKRERVLVYQSSLMAVAPIIAPVIGAQVLRFTTWRGTFFILSAMGLLLFGGSLFLSETAEKYPQKSVFQTLGNIKSLVGTASFFWPLVLVALSGIPILLFVGGASDIYITHFGLSEQKFSLFFGFNSAFSVLGPFLYIIASKKFDINGILRFSFFFIAIDGLCIYYFGQWGPYAFALSVVPGTLAGAILRPPSMNLLLEQGRKDAGTASSLMNFTFLTTGSIGMLIISLDWSDRISIFALVTLLSGLLPFLIWPFAWRKIQ